MPDSIWPPCMNLYDMTGTGYRSTVRLGVAQPESVQAAILDTDSILPPTLQPRWSTDGDTFPQVCTPR